MMTCRLAALALALCAVSGSVDAAERSRAVTREFERAHPCPSTGRTSGQFDAKSLNGSASEIHGAATL